MNIRKALTKMRISANNLEIETGRYANKTYNEEFIDRNERYCTLCKERGENIVGDEIHAALHCKSFDNQREKLMKNFNEKTKNFNSLPDREKLIYMLTCENELAKKVGKFFMDIFSCNRPNLRGEKRKKTNVTKTNKNKKPVN